MIRKIAPQARKSIYHCCGEELGLETELYPFPSQPADPALEPRQYPRLARLSFSISARVVRLVGGPKIKSVIGSHGSLALRNWSTGFSESMAMHFRRPSLFRGRINRISII